MTNALRNQNKVRIWWVELLKNVVYNSHGLMGSISYPEYPHIFDLNYDGHIWEAYDQ